MATTTTMPRWVAPLSRLHFQFCGAQLSSGRSRLLERFLATQQLFCSCVYEWFWSVIPLWCCEREREREKDFTSILCGAESGHLVMWGDPVLHALWQVPLQRQGAPPGAPHRGSPVHTPCGMMLGHAGGSCTVSPSPAAALARVVLGREGLQACLSPEMFMIPVECCYPPTTPPHACAIPHVRKGTLWI